MDEYAVMAGWARERLIAVRRATPAPGGDVKALAREVAGGYRELAAFLPEVQPQSGDPERWAPDAVVKAGAAVVGVLDELRNPEGPGKKRDLPELFFAASLERTLTGSPAGVEAACVSALTGDAEQLWARAFGKLLVYAISVPVVGLIDDLTGMLAEAVAARRWTNLHRQLVVCGNELLSSPVALPELGGPGRPPREPRTGDPAAAGHRVGIAPPVPQARPHAQDAPIQGRHGSPRTPSAHTRAAGRPPGARAVAEHLGRHDTTASPAAPVPAGRPPEGPRCPGEHAAAHAPRARGRSAAAVGDASAVGAAPPERAASPAAGR
ncbi:hypothetical protein [Streptomyces mirabilis]|uniref:hypothetical protein n=1 Tax=Streptomyces mirabilis TaxID=68239 RepID=UPI0036DC827B